MSDSVVHGNTAVAGAGVLLFSRCALCYTGVSDEMTEEVMYMVCLNVLPLGLFFLILCVV